MNRTANGIAADSGQVKEETTEERNEDEGMRKEEISTTDKH